MLAIPFHSILYACISIYVLNYCASEVMDLLLQIQHSILQNPKLANPHRSK